MSEVSRCSSSVKLGGVAYAKKVHKKSGPKPAFITLASPELEIIGHCSNRAILVRLGAINLFANNKL